MKIFIAASNDATREQAAAALRRCNLGASVQFGTLDQLPADIDCVVADAACIDAMSAEVIDALPVPLVDIDAVRSQAGAPLNPEALQDAIELTCLRHATRGREDNDLYDRLTGLPDRRLFLDRLDRATREAARSDRRLAVLVFDLDLAHTPAAEDAELRDTLLYQVAARFGRVVRHADTIARIGGDRFAAVLETGDSTDGGVIVAEKIRERLNRPFHVRGTTLHLNATVGLALFPDHGERGQQLLYHAEAALAQGRSAGAPITLHSAVARPEQPGPLMSHNLRGALADEQLFTMLQPQVSLVDARVVGMEALVRWRHPQLGLLGPTKFLPMAERSEHLATMTEQVLDQALRVLRHLHDSGRELGVSVNLSTRLLDREDLTDEVDRLLRAAGVQPRHLCLEVTETAIVSSPELAGRTLSALSELGVGIAIDDFGTGYSSLQYLRSFPIDEIKIDRLFVTDLAAGKRDALIVDSIIALGRAFGVRVLAEGVESVEACRELRKRGCEFGQGYLFGQPMIPTEFEHWLEHWEARVSGGWRPWDDASNSGNADAEAL